MFAALFILLGILLGVALSILVLVVVRTKESQISGFIATGPTYFTNGNGAYIAGLSDEESAFRDALPDDKQVEIL